MTFADLQHSQAFPLGNQALDSIHSPFNACPRRHHRSDSQTKQELGRGRENKAYLGYNISWQETPVAITPRFNTWYLEQQRSSIMRDARELFEKGVRDALGEAKVYIGVYEQE